MSDEETTQRRLELEARACIGVLTSPRIPEVASQGAKVEVFYEDDHGDEHAGYFRCHVPVDESPYDGSAELVAAEADKRGWSTYEICDTSSW